MSPKADAYQAVTDRIIEALEGGTVPWHKPWKNLQGVGPTSLQTGREYRGINVWILSVEAMLKGYTSPYWATFKQAKERAVAAARAEGRDIEERTGKKGTYYVEQVDGEWKAFRGGVRKGEKATQVVLWKPVRKTEKNEKTGEDEERRFLVLRTFSVFNVEQCDGVDGPEMPELPEDHSPIDAAEAIVTGWSGRPTVKHGGNRAYYSPALDYIQMPLSGQFAEAEGYYATLFHELAHSTGHSSRLARKSLISPTPFGTPDYSKEELVAELAAGFLCGEAGIPVNVEQSASYIASWLKVLKDDRKLIVHAAAQAQKAADLVLGIEPYKGEEEPNGSPSVNHSSQGGHHDRHHRSERRATAQDPRRDHRPGLGLQARPRHHPPRRRARGQGGDSHDRLRRRAGGLLLRPPRRHEAHGQAVGGARGGGRVALLGQTLTHPKGGQP